MEAGRCLGFHLRGVDCYPRIVSNDCLGDPKRARDLGEAYPRFLSGEFYMMAKLGKLFFRRRWSCRG